MSGQNSYHLDQYGFVDALRRFGIDSPVANITKRLSFYGNTEDIMLMMKNAAFSGGGFDMSIYTEDNVDPVKKE